MSIIKIVAGFEAPNGDGATNNESFSLEIIYPSDIVKKTFRRNQKMSAKEFAKMAIDAMKASNDRVKDARGYSCALCLFYIEKLKKILARDDIKNMNVTIKAIVG